MAKLLDDSRIYADVLAGQKLSRCDWGLDYNDGVGLLMPHLSRSCDAARLAALDARRAFERHDWHTGWNDALAVMALGRNVSSDPIINWLRCCCPRSTKSAKSSRAPRSDGPCC